MPGAAGATGACGELGMVWAKLVVSTRAQDIPNRSAGPNGVLVRIKHPHDCYQWVFGIRLS